MSASERILTNSGELISEAEAEKEELQNMLSSVIYKRKTIPKTFMELHEDIIRYEIKQMEAAKVKIEDNVEKLKFLNLVHKLKRLRPVHVSFDELNEAEKKVKSGHKNLSEINLYLSKRQHYKS